MTFSCYNLTMTFITNNGQPLFFLGISIAAYIVYRISDPNKK